jgi:para-nitrobenzyl esterase
MRKKYSVVLLIALIIQVKITSAQYCGSSRYDSEIFSSVHVTSNLNYGSSITATGTTQTLTLDVYEPDGDSLAMRPLIVWVHGGSFVGGTKNDADVTSLCQHFAKRGYVCASIEYRLGFASFPPTQVMAEAAVFRAVQDMKAAIRFFRKDSATVNAYRIDPSMIFGGGSSAGAFTALHLAYLNEPSEIPAGIDTMQLGGIEGNSGNPGYDSNINAVIDLCGALGNKNYIKAGDIPFCAMHGNSDQTVPYGTAIIYLLGVFPIMTVDGSYSISNYANSIGVHNVMYTYYGADHVPYLSNVSYMDTTVRFVSNFLYSYLGCNPSDSDPLPNTFTTGVENILSGNELNIYPNPADHVLHIELNNLGDKIISVSLHDISGRIVLTKNDFENEIDLVNFQSGIYILNVTTEKGIARREVVIN